MSIRSKEGKAMDHDKLQIAGKVFDIGSDVPIDIHIDGGVMDRLTEMIRSRTIEEIRALIVAEQLDSGEYSGCPTCGDMDFTGYTLDTINEVLDKAKISKPLWQK